MPRIQLKPNSPEFEDFKPRPHTIVCDMPSCAEPGHFRAPKNKELSEYYNLCEHHIKEYNSAWNYFADMSEEEKEKHYRDSLYGHRPTWKYGVNPEDTEELLRKARAFSGDENASFDEKLRSERFKKTNERFIAEITPETEAMKAMGLSAPLTLSAIKKRYKELAKTYHPDFNHGDKAAEEKLKEINMAYTILKVAYEKYEQINL